MTIAHKLRRLILLLPLLWVQPLVAQIDLYIGGEFMVAGIQDTVYVRGDIIYNAFGNGKICMVALSHLYFTGNFINENYNDLPFYVDPSPLLRSRGTAIAVQGFPQEIGGNGKVNFHALRIEKVLENQSVILSNDISLTDKLSMVTGDLNVDSSRVFFSRKDTSSYIVGENDLNRVFGSVGYLETKRFGNQSQFSPGRLGLTFTGLQDSVLVRRHFTSFGNVTSGSINRYFTLKSGNLSVQSASMVASYLDSSETSGYGNEANFKMYRSNDAGASWAGLPSSVNTSTDNVTAPSMAGNQSDTLIYTIADSDCPTPPTISLGADTSFCAGDSVLLDPGNGPGYNFLWSNGATTQTITVGGISDTLSVLVSDANGCIAGDTVIVTRNALPFVSLSDTVTSCAGIPVSLDALNSGSSFQWSTGDTLQIVQLLHQDTIVGLDTIWVVVTDSNGCQSSDSSIFRKNPAPLVNLGASQSLCGGSNVQLNAAWPGPSGNTGPSYNWSTGATVAAITVGTTGLYHVTVTNTWSCQTSDTVQVNVAPGLTAVATRTNITCNGAVNGQISLSVGGGTPPYSYLWSNSATTQNLSNLGPGTYTVTVTDLALCTQVTNATITQPPALLNTISKTNVTCNGAADGTASINVSGGTLPYSYLWSNSATTSALTGLGGGVFSVTVTDGNGCQISNSVTVTEPSVLTITLTNQQNPSCFGSTNGLIDITPTGGNGGFTYLWSNSATSQDISNLSAGTYGVTVTDVNGCQATGSYTLTQSAAIVLSETHVNVLCNGALTGSIDLTATGGTGTLSYQWSNAATTQDITGLAANTYTVTVTDQNLCTSNLSATITQPSALVLTMNSYPATCGQSDGSAALQVSGGETPYNYFWPHNGSILDSLSNLAAGIYTCRLTDGNGCLDSANAVINNLGAPTLTVDSMGNVDCFGNANGFVATSATGGATPYNFLWSNGGTTPTITGLQAGIYNLTVTAFDGCQAFISQPITQPTALSSAGIVTNVNCFGDQSGAIDLIPGGGTAPYAYAWSNSQNTQDLSNLAAGSYIVTIIDSAGCSLPDTFNVTEPPQLQTAILATDIGCAGGSDGSVDLTVTGGTPTYNYNWSNGQLSQDLSNLIAGNYFVTVTDQKGCTALDTAVINEAISLVIALDSTDITCNGNADGAVDLTVNGGSLPYNFAWSNSSSSEDISGLNAGNYSVTVTDDAGCTANGSTVINEPNLLQMNLTSTDVYCGGNNTGTATAAVLGGTGAYTFLWNTNASDSLLLNLTAGTYSATVTDENGCNVSQQVQVIEPPTLSASGTISDVTCLGQEDGMVLVTTFGGSAPYAYNWSNGDSIADLIGVVAANYTLTVTDLFGCTFVDTFAVESGDSALQARFLVATVVRSDDTVYFLELSVPNPNQVLWDFGDGNTSTQQYPFHVYAENPNEDTSYYDVKLIASNAFCTDSVTKQMKVINGPGKTDPENPGSGPNPDILGLIVFPNPNQGQFEVKIDLVREMDARIVIYDLAGRLVDRKSLSGSSNYKPAFNYSNMVQGVYLLRVSTATSSKVVRVVIL